MNNHSLYKTLRRKRRPALVAAMFLLGSSAVPAAAYVPDDRWAVTASGATAAAGKPITLTWSFAPDGTNIPGEGASNLVSYFDGLFGVTGGGRRSKTVGRPSGSFRVVTSPSGL